MIHKTGDHPSFIELAYTSDPIAYDLIGVEKPMIIRPPDLIVKLKDGVHIRQAIGWACYVVNKYEYGSVEFTFNGYFFQITRHHDPHALIQEYYKKFKLPIYHNIRL